MSDKTYLQDALQSALDFECRGHDYYLAVAGKAKNPLTKEVFTALAGQELIHMEKIQEVYDNLDFQGVTPHPHAGSVEKLIRGVFDRFAKEERDAWAMDQADAYEYAKDLERRSIVMYDGLAKKSDNPVEAAFFEALKAEENDHLTVIENVYFYLTRTGDWFASQEDRVWNWMNT